MSAVVSIPRYPGDVTAEWLSAALSERRAPVEVSGVDVVAIGTGQTGATYRVTASYATDPGDLPQTFVIKLPAQDDTVRDRVVIGYRSECAFYSSVADRVHADTAVFLLRDHRGRNGFCPAARRSGTGGAGRSARRLRGGRARLAVTALRGLHAPSWCDPVWLEFPGIGFGRPTKPVPMAWARWRR